MDDGRFNLVLEALDRGDDTGFLRAYNAISSLVAPDVQPKWLHLLLDRHMLDAASAIMGDCDVLALDETGTSPLMIAASRGYTEICAQIMSTDTFRANSPSVGEALALAVANEHLGVCRLLVSADKAAGSQMLFAAIAADSTCDVNVLLASGVSADSKQERGKLAVHAIHDAIGRPSILLALIRNGANINSRDSNGQTVLSLAAAKGDVLTCDLLINEGASLVAKDTEGRSPMFHSCVHERDAVIQRLIALGESIDTMDNRHRTPLFVHVERGHLNGCKTMLRYNADLFHKDASNFTVLHIAASRGLRNVCRLLVEELLEHPQANAAADQQPPDIADDVQCKTGSSPWTAVSSGMLLRVYGDIVANGPKHVLSKLGSLLVRDFSLNTLAHLAVTHASDAQCAYLVRCLHDVGGVPVVAQNCFRESALDMALARGHVIAAEALRLLSDVDGSGSFRVQLGGTISRSVGLTPRDTSTTRARAFTECSRARLDQLCRGIESGVYTCADEVVWQLDTERGDTVLHYFLRDFCGREKTPFPSESLQARVLRSSSWLGADPRLVRALLSKRNWEGMTPLHVAAQVGAYGFCVALVESGARASEECSAIDKRLVDSPNEPTDLWKAINFAAGRSRGTQLVPSLNTCEDGTAGEEYRQREELVQFLMDQSDALPMSDSAFADLRDKIYDRFPRLLPRLLAARDGVWSASDTNDARRLYAKLVSVQAGHRDAATAREVVLPPLDPSGIALHQILLDTQKHGVHVLAKYCVGQLVIESTGDSLLHLVAAHAHPSALSILRYLLNEGGMNVNHKNKQFKTALHVACEQQASVEICCFLVSHGADVTASCQNVRAPAVGPWFTPLYCALWSASPSFPVLEMLLTLPLALVEPRNPRLDRSDSGAAVTIKWNVVVMKRLVDVHPGALPLFLDHYATAVNTHLHGGTLYQFAHVRHACEHLDLVLRPTATLAQLYHKYSPSLCVTHPVVRNAIHLKWKLFGLRCHRRQLALYVAMLLCFYLANVVLPKLDTLLNSDSSSVPLRFTWVDFQSKIDYAVAVCKGACWLLAAFHLVYVELYLEWRADRGRYWRSLWNMLDLGTYVLVLATIPLEFLGDDYRVARECLLGLLSILLCINLMQALLVSSFLSVLIFTFARMCRVVAQFFVHYLLLLLGFAGGFHLLFHGYGPHTNVLSTTRVVVLAMFGELNYNRNFYAAEASPVRNACGFALLVLYVVVVMIVAVNLLTALMTSEYEHVRSQAEERALLELAGALHRYEQWLGASVVASLYDTPRGVALLQACERRIPSQDGGSNRPEGRHRWKLLTREQTLVSGTVTGIGTSHGERDNVVVDATTELLAVQVARRMAEDTANLRAEMASRFQEIQESVAVMARQPNEHSPRHREMERRIDLLHDKLDALLETLQRSAAKSGSDLEVPDSQN